MKMFEKPIDVFWNIIGPLHFMCLSAYYLPITIVNLILTRQFSVLLSPPAAKEAWFARFWSWAGPLMREDLVLITGPLISQACGVVLDIGPGGGEWINLYDKEKVTKVGGSHASELHVLFYMRFFRFFSF